MGGAEGWRCHRTNTCPGNGPGVGPGIGSGNGSGEAGVVVGVVVDVVVDVVEVEVGGEQGSALIAFSGLSSSFHVPTLANIRSPPGRIANTQWVALSRT